MAITCNILHCSYVIFWKHNRAVILNRTIVLIWNKKTNFCENSTFVQSWISRKDAVDSLLLKARCPWQSSTQAGIYRVGGRERAIRCCGHNGVEGINATWLSPGSTAKLLLQPLAGSARIASPATQSRFAILFSNPHRLSSFESYGVLAHFSLQFSNYTRSLCSQVLQKAIKVEDLYAKKQPPIILAMQIRHQKLNRTVEAKIDDGMSACLREFRRQHFDRSCVVLLATDRASTITRMEKEILAVNCSLHLVPKGNAVRTSAFPLRSHGEHGPWGDSMLAMADWFLLGHADYFIGTQISSYSTLIANSIAARRLYYRDSYVEGEEFLWGILVQRVVQDHLKVLKPCEPYRDKGVEIIRNCSLSRHFYDYKSQRCELYDY